MPDEALLDASGADLKEWDTRWRAYLAERPHETLPAVFGLGGPTASHGHSDLRELSKRARLAELLMGRDHPAEALVQIDHITSPEALEDPSVRYLRARILESLDRVPDGAPLVADPKSVVSSFGPWWAVRGRWARAGGGETIAGPAFFEAVAADPLDVEAACEGIDPASTPKDPLALPLCDAARARNEPGLGKD
jgi:hypothetical protein